MINKQSRINCINDGGGFALDVGKYRAFESTGWAVVIDLDFGIDSIQMIDFGFTMICICMHEFKFC
jgi:hypothetical protein